VRSPQDRRFNNRHCRARSDWNSHVIGAVSRSGRNGATTAKPQRTVIPAAVLRLPSLNPAGIHARLIRTAASLQGVRAAAHRHPPHFEHAAEPIAGPGRKSPANSLSCRRACSTCSTEVERRNRPRILESSSKGALAPLEYDLYIYRASPRRRGAKKTLPITQIHVYVYIYCSAKRPSHRSQVSLLSFQ
jgi:hypothetical protein